MIDYIIVPSPIWEYMDDAQPSYTVTRDGNSIGQHFVTYAEARAWVQQQQQQQQQGGTV